MVLSLFNTAQCTGSSGTTYFSAERRPEPDGWQHIDGVVTTDSDTRSALLTLVGSCNSSSGIAVYYYDDIFIAPDSILAADFEEHAPEGGPSQPPG